MHHLDLVPLRAAAGLVGVGLVVGRRVFATRARAPRVGLPVHRVRVAAEELLHEQDQKEAREQKHAESGNIGGSSSPCNLLAGSAGAVSLPAGSPSPPPAKRAPRDRLQSSSPSEASPSMCRQPTRRRPPRPRSPGPSTWAT
ncbi:unnamed protein product, partial [Prorocentrum cordatum]